MFDAHTGQERWRFEYPTVAKESLDFGNSPRATPLLVGNRAYLLGAFGHLHCLDLPSGKLQWFAHLAEEYKVAPPKWGFSGSPLRVEAGIVVQPGAPDAAVAAFHPETGEVVWETPGRRAAYSSGFVASLGGQTQILSLDEAGLVGWDATSGRELWHLSPTHPGDFNVPTPFLVGSHLFTATENNGARLYRFNAEGIPAPKPLAFNEELSPDSHSPVPAGEHLFGLGQGGVLLCLKALDLSTQWTTEEPIGHYASMISDGQSRVLTLTDRGGLYLHETASPIPLGFLQLPTQRHSLVAHPALVGNRLYLRMGTTLACLEL